MSEIEPTVGTNLICYHCGDICKDDGISIGDKLFCCNGCKTVYELLESRDLCNYYSIESQPGISPQEAGLDHKYGYLDDSDVQQKLIEFSNGNVSRVTFEIPEMHCASCIWLLEKLPSLNTAITSSRVNFLKRQITLTFKSQVISLKALVKLLVSIGYEPRISLQNIREHQTKYVSRKLSLQIGIAGFAFANIMLFSLPEYLSGSTEVEPFLQKVFSWASLVLSIPVAFYCAQDYWISAFKGIRQKAINMDVPIVLGVLALFVRSSYEIVTATGSGYFDSLTGLIFFLLIGKVFQKKTYDRLSFERDYTAYFPMSVIKKDGDNETSIPVARLKTGDRILIRNSELIPADSVIMSGHGLIDYSFVTGESQPVSKSVGDLVYAGGRQTGELIELEVIAEVSQSYLTRLWNDDVFTKKQTDGMASLANRVSKYFTVIIIVIALVSAGFWATKDFGMAFNVFTAVLIVACPCALALSTPFTLGTAVRILGRNKLYVKNTQVVENMASVDAIVFDKTGTLTISGESILEFRGDQLTDSEKTAVKSVTRHSTHPYSRIIYKNLSGDIVDVQKLNESIGMGIEGTVGDDRIKIGRLDWIGNHVQAFQDLGTKTNSAVFIGINDKLRGVFVVSNKYRTDVKTLINKLSKRYKLNLLSGDSDSERLYLTEVFGGHASLKFNQSPIDKLQYIKELQDSGKNVVMIGDGLNDAGALAASNVGMAVTDDTTSFSPASDALIDAEKISSLDRMMMFAKQSVQVIRMSFGLSLAYNIIGLSFAVGGMLSPIISAILMPVSSISVVAFATLATIWKAKTAGLEV